MNSTDFESRVAQYVDQRKLTVDSCAGAGTQGTVLVCNYLSQTNSIEHQVAVKFHEREVAYDREVSIYLRLRDLEIVEVSGHMVPQLVHYDDELLAIEMTIVSPPFCLDFGGAYLDRPPDYSPEVWADWEAEKSDLFEDNWNAVEEILSDFRLLGIYIADVNPGNIRF